MMVVIQEYTASEWKDIGQYQLTLELYLSYTYISK